jgi:hypothetical protein
MEAVSDLVALKERIIRCASDIGYPGDDNIIAHRGRHLEKKGIAAYFQGSGIGRKLPKKAFRATIRETRRNVWPFMTADAFHYYLPAYLATVIDDFDNADVLYDYTMTRLTRLGDPVGKHSFPRGSMRSPDSVPD